VQLLAQLQTPGPVGWRSGRVMLVTHRLRQLHPKVGPATEFSTLHRRLSGHAPIQFERLVSVCLGVKYREARPPASFLSSHYIWWLHTYTI